MVDHASAMSRVKQLKVHLIPVLMACSASLILSRSSSGNEEEEAGEAPPPFLPVVAHASGGGAAGLLALTSLSRKCFMNTSSSSLNVLRCGWRASLPNTVLQ